MTPLDLATRPAAGRGGADLTLQPPPHAPTCSAPSPAGPRTLRPGSRSLLPVIDATALMVPVAIAGLQGRAVQAVLVTAAVTVVLLQQAGLYRPRLHLSLLDEAPALAGRLAAGTGIGTLVLLTSPGLPSTRFAVTVLLGAGCLLMMRSVTYALMRCLRRRGHTVQPTVVVGGGRIARDLAETLHKHPEYGLQPAGYVDSLPSTLPTTDLAYLGPPAELAKLVHERGVTVLLVAFGSAPEHELLQALRSDELNQCEVLIVPRLFEIYSNHQGDHLGAVPVVRRRRTQLAGPSWALKRLFDVVVSAMAILVLTPMLAACALAVRLEGGSGVIFRQARVGKDGQVFDVLKFRSLKPADESDSATTWTVAGDPRMGPVGKLLRRTSLDELPQLWNILRGEMTVVGPRPERPHFVSRFASEVHRYDERHRVPCGLTGLAQVSGLRGDTSISDRARFDNYYIENWSLWLDVKVIVRTASEVLFARGG